MDIESFNLSNKNKEILTSYKTYLITVKFLNVETTINSYILDIYKTWDKSTDAYSGE